MKVLQFVRVRTSDRCIAAFIGNRKSFQHAEASSEEAAVRCRTGKPNSLEAAKLVGFTLAERMKQKEMIRAKFNIQAEFAEKPPKFHPHVRAIAEALRNNGITLVD